MTLENNKKIIYIYKVINNIPKYNHLYYIGATTSELKNKLNMFYNKACSYNPDKHCFNLLYQLIIDFGIKYFKIECIKTYNNNGIDYNEQKYLNKYHGNNGNMNLIINYSQKVFQRNKRNKKSN